MKSEFPYNITDYLEENDFWLCEHQVFDSYAIFQFKKNSEIIEVGLLTNIPEEEIKLIKKRENEVGHQMILDEISRKTRGVPLETYLYKYSHEACLNAIGLLIPHMMVNLGFKYLCWAFVPVPDTEKYRIAVALEREKIFYTVSVVEKGYFFSLTKPHFDLLEFVRKVNDHVEDKLEELDNSLPKGILNEKEDNVHIFAMRTKVNQGKKVLEQLFYGMKLWIGGVDDVKAMIFSPLFPSYIFFEASFTKKIELNIWNSGAKEIVQNVDFSQLKHVLFSNDIESIQDDLEDLKKFLIKDSLKGVLKRKSELSSIMNAQDAEHIATIEDLMLISFSFSNNPEEELEELSCLKGGGIIMKKGNPIKLEILPGGNFNSELEEVMDLISRLSFLEELLIDAYHSGMGGLPDSILKLKNLKKLTIVEEDNFGFIPEEIGKLESLNYLKLESGMLQHLPESIGNLPNLKKLMITDHYIEVLPDSMQNLSNLEYLDLSGNLLKSIPEWFLKLPSLRVLHIGRQQSGDKWLLKDKVAHKLKKKGVEVL